MINNYAFANARQTLKAWLVSKSTESIFTRSVLHAYSLSFGARLQFRDSYISIRKNQIEIRLSPKHLVCVPAMLQRFNLYSATFVATRVNDVSLLDFSIPRIHRFSESGTEFYFPSIPEEGFNEAYTHWYQPQSGQCVFDIGAHSGASTYLFSNMVGPAGRVFAFEPDDTNYEYLLKNIEKHQMTNVVPIKKAISGITARLPFTMSGTIGSGLAKFLLYPDSGVVSQVDCLTISDACSETGVSPDFIKMDIEGAELDAITGALEFLSHRGIHFALDTNHDIGGDFTWNRIEQLFRSINYEVKSSNEYGGLWTTWARPPLTPMLLS